MRVSPLLAVALVILVGGAECTSWNKLVNCITSKLGYGVFFNSEFRWLNRHAPFTPATPLLIQNHRVSPITNHVHRHHSPHSSPPILISHTIPFPPTPCHSLPHPATPSHTLPLPTTHCHSLPHPATPYHTLPLPTTPCHSLTHPPSTLTILPGHTSSIS